MTVRAAALVTLAAFGLAACASKVAPPPDPVVVSDVQNDPGKVRAEESVTVSATVKSVDHKSRVVELLGPDGEDIVFRAGPEVRNLAQLKKGDIVQATYRESIAIELKKPGTATPGIVEGAAADRAKLGERPGAAAAESVQVTATVVKVDRKNSTITLKGPQGNTKTLPVRNKAHFDVVKVGDLVQVTYTEAIGIAVVPPAK